MSRKTFLLLLLAAMGLPLPTWAQHGSPSSKPNATPVSPHTPFTMKAYSRMVTLDVVVENKKGRHIKGLKAGDFEVYEQTPSQSNKKHVQKISDLQEVHTAALRPPVEAPANLPPGVYTNAVQVQKDPVPPTVLLLDGINTPFRYQMQVHSQMLKMLQQLPPHLPVAVLLMGYHLRVLQSFTTNHELVQQALAKALSVTGQGLGHMSPIDNPDAAGNLLGALSSSATGSDAGLVAAAKSFDEAEQRYSLLTRFNRTNRVFLSIAQSLRGYPGRKNVLWLSTSFPLLMNDLPENRFRPTFPDLKGYLNLEPNMERLSRALQNAKVAIYPVDIGGVRTLHVFEADARPANPYEVPVPDSKRILAASWRQTDMWSKEHDTMYSIAKATGGKVCLGENYLSNCIRKAVHDSSDFYEISYYPNSKNWKGAYRKIIVKVDRHGARLSYRRGYYAMPEENPDPKTQAAAMRKDCGELLNATGIEFTATTLPSKTPGQLTYRLAIDPSKLTFIKTPNGKQQVHLVVGACTYNRRGWSQKMMTYPLSLTLNARDYHALMAGGHVRDAIYVPGPRPSAIRLLVKDVPSGKLGSIYIHTEKPKAGK